MGEEIQKHLLLILILSSSLAFARRTYQDPNRHVGTEGPSTPHRIDFGVSEPLEGSLAEGRLADKLGFLFELTPGYPYSDRLGITGPGLTINNGETTEGECKF